MSQKTRHDQQDDAALRERLENIIQEELDWLQRAARAAESGNSTPER